MSKLKIAAIVYLGIGVFAWQTKRNGSGPNNAPISTILTWPFTW